MIDEPLALLAEAFGEALQPEAPPAPCYAGQEPTMMGALRTLADADAIIAAASMTASDASRPSARIV